MDSLNLINRLAEEILVDHNRKKNQVYLVTSAVDGEGVTHTCELLLDSMRKLTPGKVYLLSVPKHDVAQAEYVSSPDDHRAEFFNELKANYNVILIDAGGLLRRDRAIPFLSECHSCILVTKAGHTRRGQVKETIEMLKRYDIPILGAVLNGVRRVIPQWLYKRL